MTSTVSLKDLKFATGARTGERGKGELGKGPRFADTLAGAVGASEERTLGTRASTQPTQRPAALEAYQGTHIAFQSTDSSLASELWRATSIDNAVNPANAADGGTTEEQDETDIDGIFGMLGYATDLRPVNIQPQAGETTTHDAEDLAARGDGAEESKPLPSPEKVSASRIVSETVVSMRSAPEPSPSVGEPRTRNMTSEVQTAGSKRTDRQNAESPTPSMQRVAAADAQLGTSARASIPPAAPSTQPPSQPPREPDSIAPRTELPTYTAEDAPDQPAAAKTPTSGPASDIKADSLGSRISVIATSSTPAPAPASVQVLGSTSAGLVADLAAAPPWRTAAKENGFGARPGSPGAVQSLRIQLHPIELGMVTARLTQTGSEMSIEIQVESNDARQRLSNDSEQIVKALRAVGIEVEKVTIQQAPSSPPNVTAQQYAGTRDTGSQQQQQASAENGSRGQGERGAASRQDEGTRHDAREAAANRTGVGLYI